MKTQILALVLTPALVFLGAGRVVLAQQGAAAKPAPAAGAEEAPATQETSEGTIRLFKKAMRQGDFTKIVELCDPGAEAYHDLQQMAAAFDPEHRNPNIPEPQLEMVREFFSKPWQHVDHKQVTEQGPRAQYTLTFFTVDARTKERTQTGTRTVDLNKVQDKWFVLVSSELMRPAAPTTIPQANPAPTPPAGEAPAKN